jgi:hypothetical protein
MQNDEDIIRLANSRFFLALLPAEESLKTVHQMLPPAFGEVKVLRAGK